jgi:hypothetical protein
VAILSSVLAEGAAAGTTFGWKNETYVAKPAYWCPPGQTLCWGTRTWRTGGTYWYALSGITDPDAAANIDAEMAILNGANPGYEPGSWANVPRFYKTTNLSLAIKYGIVFYYSGKSPFAFDSKTLGYSSGWQVQINSTMKGASIRALVAHEMGHQYGLWHTAADAGPLRDQDKPSLTIMSQGIRPEKPGWNLYGSCDMAGLQARYGLGSGYNKLSKCLPNIVLTGPSGARVGSSITLTATLTGRLTGTEEQKDATTTTYYVDKTATSPGGPYSGAIDYTGLDTTRSPAVSSGFYYSMHLFGIDVYEKKKDLGVPAQGACGSGRCTWSIPTFGTYTKFYVGSPWVTAPFTDTITIDLL